MHLRMRMHIDFLVEDGINEGVFDVQLMNLHAMHAADSTEQTKTCIFDNRGKCIRVINTLDLAASVDHKPGLVSDNLSVLCLLLVDEMTPQKFLGLSSWVRDELPAPPLFLQSCYFLMHGPPPFGFLFTGQGCSI